MMAFIHINFISKVCLWVLATVVAVVLSAILFGCEYGDQLSDAVWNFKNEHPTVKIVEVDADGDTETDYLAADTDGDGVLEEIDGTRKAYTNAGMADSDVADILKTIGLIVGLPGFGYAGRLWGRRKPIKMFTTLVRKFEDAREGGTINGSLHFSKDVLDTIKDIPELQAKITTIRNENKTPSKG